MSIKDLAYEYFDYLNPKYLTKGMLAEVLALPSPWKEDNLYGLIAYYRTYSRWIPQLKRRESWVETCMRVTEYSFSLVEEQHVNDSEVHLFFTYLYRMKFLVSGRTLWRGDKDNQDATANYNCSFMTIDSYQKYGEMCYLLMEGAGVGFSVERKYTSKLPQLWYEIPIDYIEPENPVKAGNPTTKLFVFEGKDKAPFAVTTFNKISTENTIYPSLLNSDDHALIKVGDSRMGWATAISVFFKILSLPNPVAKITLDFSEVRKEGALLKTMGGTASGHGVLMQAFKKVAWIIWLAKGKLEPIHCLDIANCIAEAVVCGGVRRSAQIALGDIDDRSFITAKHNLYSSYYPETEEGMWERHATSLAIDDQDDKYRWRKSRVLSNNSVMLYDDISVENLRDILQYSKEFGEPGLINAKTALERFPGFKGVNPCAEILLDDRGLCNLGELVLPRMSYPSEVQYVAGILTRHLIRITLPELFMKEWTRTNNKWRLLGVSLCGVQESHFTYDTLKEVRYHAQEEAVAYSAQLGISVPYNVTTVKPGGTIPTLPGVSSGMHSPYAPHYLHRIRVGRNHPINYILQGMDIKFEPEVGYSESNTPRWVYTIPCKSLATQLSFEESALNQLERYKKLMTYWCDQNVSCTISADMDTEFDEVVKWIHNNLDTFVGISLFPKFDPRKGTPMPLLPLEPIEKEDYYNIPFNVEEFHDLFCTLKDTQEEDLDETACEKGFCPNR